jgi:hypothetical protein
MLGGGSAVAAHHHLAKRVGAAVVDGGLCLPFLAGLRWCDMIITIIIMIIMISSTRGALSKRHTSSSLSLESHRAGIVSSSKHNIVSSSKIRSVSHNSAAVTLQSRTHPTPALVHRHIDAALCSRHTPSTTECACSPKVDNS